MIRIPGGTFRMGSDQHYPEEAPVHRVTVDAFWIDRTPVTNRQFRRFVEATGHVTVAEIAPDPKDYPGALPHMLHAGSLVFSPPDYPVDLRRLEPVVGVQAQGDLAPSLRPGLIDQGPRRPSGRACRLCRCGGLCRMGRQGPADRGRMGVRRPWRTGPGGVRLGRRAHAGRPPDGQHLAGRVSVPEHASRRLRAHLAGHRLPAERLRPLRHDRQCLGMDQRLLRAEASGRCTEGVLHPREPARRARGPELRSLRARIPGFRAGC